MGDFTGPKTFEEWIDVYERRAGDDVHFQLDEDEHIYWHPDNGFFTWYVCREHAGRISVPKMCGNGKVLRRMVWELVKAMESQGFHEVMLCSRRRPEVYCRVIGGRLDHIEYTVNLNTGRREPLYFYVINFEDTKEGERHD